MKKLTFLIFILFATVTVFGQDYLYKTNGEKLAVKIIDKENGTVMYRLYGVRDVTTFKISTAEIFMIEYVDGKVENFTSKNKESVIENNPIPQENTNSFEFQETEHDVKFASKKEEDLIKSSKKNKGKTLIDNDYNRNSMTILCFNNTASKNPNIEKAIDFARIPEKFDNNNLPIARIEIPSSIDNKNDYIDDYLKNRKIFNQIIGRWFNTEDGIFDLENVKQRGMYNATDNDYLISGANKRGVAALQDMGIGLINNSYVLVISFDNIQSMEEFYKAKRTRKKDRTKNGFIGNLNGYLYKIDFNENVATSFFSELWIDENTDNYFERELKFKKFDFPFEFVGNYSAIAEGSQYNPNFRLGTKIQKSNDELLKEFTANGIDNVITSIESSVNEFRIKAPIADVNPIKVKIGKKEGVKFDQRFFVYENREDNSGSVFSKRIGVIRSKHIADNLYNASGSSDKTTFYQVAGKKLDNNGIFVEQHNDLGIGVSIGGIYKPIDYSDKFGILGRVSIYPKNGWNKLLGKREKLFSPGLFSSLFVYTDFVIHPETINRSTISFGFGKDLFFNRNYCFTPFIGYGFDQIIDSSLSYTGVAYIDMIEGGTSFGLNITHNTQFQIQSKAIWYYDLSVINMLMSSNIEPISIGISGSFKISF